MHPYILKNYLNFNYGRSYGSRSILNEKYVYSNGKRNVGENFGIISTGK
jgi:uncharacterized protein (DUF934 family)